MVHGTMVHVVCLVEEMESVAGTDGNLVKKPGCISLVWDYFGLRVDTNGKPVDDTRAVSHSC